MKIHFQAIDNLSVLLYPKLNTIDQKNSFGGTFSFKEELAYEEFHRDYLLPTSEQGVNHLTYILHERVITISHMNQRNFNYEIEFDDGVILLLTPAMRRKSCFGKIQINQPACWQDCWEKLASTIEFVKKVLDGSSSFKVLPNLIDLAVHHSGVEWTQTDGLHFTGTFKSKKLYPVIVEKGLSFSGFEIGSKGSRSRSPFVRLYDKTLQLRQQHGAPRPHALYQKPATENDKIWNLEASFGPRTLREHKIDTVELLQKSVPALWKFVTTKYLKHKAIPRKGKKDKEFDKAPLSETWLLLQRCHGVDETTPALVSTTEKLEDVSGTYQLNKIKKRLLRYAVINCINPYDLTTILEAIGEHLTSEGKLGSLKWNEFVDKHYVNPSQVGELKHLDL